MKELLFQEFEEVSAKQWKQKIQADLKGADYNEKLITHTLHGIDIKPFYNQKDLSEMTAPSNLAAWKITEKIFVTSEKEASQKAIQKIEKGAESIWFLISEKIDPGILLQNIPENIDLIFEAEFLDPDFAEKLAQLGENRKIHLLSGIISNLAEKGNWYENLKPDHEKLGLILGKSKLASSLQVDLGVYQNAGANIPQQLAYSIGEILEYANHFQNSENINLKPVFKVSVGSDYFFEISKIKALRWLYRTVSEEFDLPQHCTIIAEPSRRNKSLYDYNVNFLRTTTECMSAILGGADYISNMPYDALYHKNNEFGDRIARNQLLILKHESYFDKVENFTQGSYYIESVTKQLAEKALDIIKNIEAAGGFLSQLVNGTVQKKIKASANEEQERFNSGKLVMIGTNKFENPEDRMENELELYPFLKKNPRKTLIEPILPKRLSEEVEKGRLKKEKSQNS